MPRIPPWFDRRFEFSFPVEQFPNLLARLRGTPPRLEETVRGSRHETMVRQPDGKWSAQEHAGHLLDLEPLWMARVGDFLSGSTQMTVADLTNRKTHDANHNAQPMQDILAGFRKARMELVQSVEQLDAPSFGRSLLHPRLKTPMRLVDHLFFVAEHDDHHLAQVWDLVKD